MKKTILVLALLALAFQPLLPVITSVEREGSILTISGFMPCYYRPVARITQLPDGAIYVSIVLRHARNNGCFAGGPGEPPMHNPFTITVDVGRYLSPTAPPVILVNGKEY